MKTKAHIAGGDVEAREAALAAARDKWRRNSYDVPTIVNAAIDAYLAKLTSTEAAPSRIAEILERTERDEKRKWSAAEPPMWLVQAVRDRAYLLSHITAMNAEHQSDLESLRERCAKVAEPRRKKPKLVLGNKPHHRAAEQRSAASFHERMQIAATIRTLPLTPHTADGQEEMSDAALNPGAGK